MAPARARAHAHPATLIATACSVLSPVRSSRVGAPVRASHNMPDEGLRRVHPIRRPSSIARLPVHPHPTERMFKRRGHQPSRQCRDGQDGDFQLAYKVCRALNCTHRAPCADRTHCLLTWVGFRCPGLVWVGLVGHGLGQETETNSRAALIGKGPRVSTPHETSAPRLGL